MQRGDGTAGNDLVVVGGSAGSHPALVSLVAGLPAGLPAAVLVVIHVGARAYSRLPGILSRRGPLPAAHARDGVPLRDGQILVAPPGFHLVVEDGRARLSRGPRVNRVRPAVDVLFSSAAMHAGSRVVAVVLSGVLDDGAVGAALVSHAGGQVLVQDPAEAPYRSMPAAARAAAPGATAVPASQLAPAVARAVRRSPVPVHEGGAVDQHRGAAMKMADSSDPAFLDDGETRLTRLACPECGGVLAEISLPRISYFRCHVGHQYGPQALAAAQAETAEQKLWDAMSALEEQAVVLRHLAGHGPSAGPANGRGDDEGSAGYLEQARKIAELAGLIRAYLQRREGAG
jgi:two-component system chemotaxis response regulator CheB